MFIAIIGAVFVFFMGSGAPLTGGGPSGNAIVQLGDIRLDQTDFQRVRAQREQALRDAAGDQFDARALRQFLDSSALQTLVEGAILTHAAMELGLRVSDAEIQDVLRRVNPELRDPDNRTAFADQVEYNYGSQKAFMNVVRGDLLRQKMLRLLYSQVKVSDGEARSAALLTLEEVRIAFVALDTEALPAGSELPEDEVASHLESHREELLAQFHQSATNLVPEQARARHILIRVDRSADDEAVASARERAEQALARLRAGEAFEDLAAELSEDPGSKEKGGDLGSFARGETAAAIEDVAFTLSPGMLSEVIRSDAGFHVVRVEERIDAHERVFEDVALELARAAATHQAASVRANELADKLAAAIRAGQSLEDAARSQELDIERPAAVRRRADGFIPTLGGSQDLLGTVFTLEVDAPSSPRIFTVGTRLVLVQLLEREEPNPLALEAAAYGQRFKLESDKRNRILRDWIEETRTQLLENGQLLVDSSIVRDS
jgi:peptidyl-prolyl cis-trans isomerase D